MQDLSSVTIFSTLLIVFLAGCGVAPMNTNFPLIEKGMAMSEVTELIGEPASAKSGPEDTKIYYYRLASSFLDTDGSDTREYYVVADSGTVIGYGERTDAATIERQARQYKAAWSAVQGISQASSNVADARQSTNSQGLQQDRKSAYQLVASAYDPQLGRTICTYKEFGGSEYKVKELIGNAICPGTFF